MDQRVPSEASEANEPDMDDLDDREGSPELVELTPIEFFSSAFRRQTLAPQVSGKRVYSHGQSGRTFRRQKKVKRDLEASLERQGFVPLRDFLERKARSAMAEPEAEVTRTARIGTMSTLAPVLEEEEEEEEEAEEEEEEEEEEGDATLRVDDDEETSIHASEGGGEEADESNIASADNESEADETENEKRTASTRGGMGTMLTPRPSGGDNDISCLGWGPSRIVLHESEESSSVLDKNDALSDLDELSSIYTKEVEGLHDGKAPDHSATQQPASNAADVLRDRAGLQTAHQELSLKVKSGNLDSVLCTRVEAMMRLLNLYLDQSLGYTWTKASLVVAKSEGHGTTRARSIQKWVMTFMGTRKLPCHQHGQTRLSPLNDENVTHTIKEALIERAKSGFLGATDVMEVVSSPGVQDQLSEAGIDWPSITKSTACRWLGRLGWRHGRHQNGMYSDGHEREDVVDYRRKFAERFEQHE